LVGLAGGAAVAGCCANMVGFAIMSFRENRWGGLVSQGLGTSMLQMGNIVKNPRIWLPAILTSMITGPIATCVFKLEMNGAAINSGMGTCGLCGPIGIWTGWLNPSDVALADGAAAIVPTGMDWLGLVLVCFVLPAVLCWAFGLFFRKIGWIREGDLTLN
ncbi:MAG: PTS sugar transporter subunit IIC, partial [Oscillospiraceae bacterium]|nr:PTS sugar transporter subunit IIC [Oscillospiraceae bacterium]